jgi:exopolyphosphatase/guanosine-5'-triphosphate,3'-diphosphate pyrophosphatase
MMNVEDFAAAHDPDPAHSRQVVLLSLALFDALCVLHELDSHARELLEAAALLHDVGYAEDPASHHKKSRDMILDSGITDFDKHDLAVIACIARYHRKALPDPSHKIYRDLDAASQQVVSRLAAILRIADGLDRSLSACAKSIRVAQSGDTATILVGQAAPSPTDIEAARKKAGLFEQAFGLKVEIISVPPA